MKGRAKVGVERRRGTRGRRREAEAGGEKRNDREKEREIASERRSKGDALRRGEEGECGLQERESVVAKADRSADHPELALRLR